MVQSQMIFKRYEIKYLITREQKEIILAAMKDKMAADAYGVSRISNLYFDTPDHLLIRRSIEKPEYKEKLRLRIYGELISGHPVFAEIKKKYKSVVYKRRMTLERTEDLNDLHENGALQQTQIGREIDFFFDRYPGLQPKMFISYQRQAYYAIGNHDLRITFDDSMIYRTDPLTFERASEGFPILPDYLTMMEVKTGQAMPLWLVDVLSKNRIYKTSFSKYGTAYKICQEKTQKELAYVR